MKFRLRGKKRRAAIAALAGRLQMTYSPKDSYGLLSQLKSFRIFRIGHSKRVSNLLQKSDVQTDSNTSLFDYRYVVQAGNTPVTVSFNAYFYNSKEMGLPEFSISPKHFGHRIIEFFKGQDPNASTIDLNFSKTHVLKNDDSWSRDDLLSDELVALLQKHDKLRIEAMNYYLAIYKPKHLIRVEELEDFLAACESIKEVLRVQHRID
ncbi:MAG: hypothetical protein AAF990_13280 [Bacteroidota bacterium]